CIQSPHATSCSRASYFHYFLVIQTELRRPYDAADLLRATDAYNGPGYRLVVQRPCNRNLSGRSPVTLTHFAQHFDQAQIAGEIRFLKVLVSPAPVIWSEVRDALSRHGPGKKSGIHR